MHGFTARGVWPSRLRVHGDLRRSERVGPGKDDDCTVDAIPPRGPAMPEDRMLGSFDIDCGELVNGHRFIARGICDQGSDDDVSAPAFSLEYELVPGVPPLDGAFSTTWSASTTKLTPRCPGSRMTEESSHRLRAAPAPMGHEATGRFQGQHGSCASICQASTPPQASSGTARMGSSSLIYERAPRDGNRRHRHS